MHPSFLKSQARKPKIELTHRLSSEKPRRSSDHLEACTPPKFRTNQSAQSQVNPSHSQTSSRTVSRYQTLQSKLPGMVRTLTQSSSREPSAKKQKQLYIDTDVINHEHDNKIYKKLQDTTPLFANEDSTTILSRMQNKRKKEGISYDNLIDAIRIDYNREKSEDQLRIVNNDSRNFMISESKVAMCESRTQTVSTQETHSWKRKVKSMHRQAQELRQQMGANNKLSQICTLLAELDQELDGRGIKTEHSFAKLEQHEIQNSFLMKDYNNSAWISKEKLKQNVKKLESNRVKTTIDQKCNNGLRSKSPLREILNYVNKKR